MHAWFDREQTKTDTWHMPKARRESMHYHSMHYHSMHYHSMHYHSMHYHSTTRAHAQEQT
jgi:hypothetical protein